jgi:hypothetical protein
VAVFPARSRLTHAWPASLEIALLRSLPLFAELPAPAIEGLAAALTPIHLRAGAVLIRQGDPGDAYYAIAAGELDVFRDGHFVNRVRTRRRDRRDSPAARRSAHGDRDRAFCRHRLRPGEVLEQVDVDPRACHEANHAAYRHPGPPAPPVVEPDELGHIR